MAAASARNDSIARVTISAAGSPPSSSSTGATSAVMNDRPRVIRSTRKRSPPSTSTFMRPSSNRSITSSTRARVPSSRTP